jgi:uncharacterized protein (UPF0333 family)
MKRKGTQRGQVALEFIFILLIIIIYIFTVTKPIVENATGISEDIDSVSRANNEAQKLLNSVTRVSMMASGSKETLNMIVPKKSVVMCHIDGVIGFSTKLNVKPYPPQCATGACDKNFGMPAGLKVNCPMVTISGQGKVTVRKEADNSVTVTQG